MIMKWDEWRMKMTSEMKLQSQILYRCISSRGKGACHIITHYMPIVLTLLLSYLSLMSLQRHRTYVNVDYFTKPLSGNSWPDSGQSVKFTVGRKHGIRQDKVCIQLVTIQLNGCYVVETGTVMGGLRSSSSAYIPTSLRGRTVLRVSNCGQSTAHITLNAVVCMPPESMYSFAFGPSPGLSQIV